MRLIGILYNFKQILLDLLAFKRLSGHFGINVVKLLIKTRCFKSDWSMLALYGAVCGVGILDCLLATSSSYISHSINHVSTCALSIKREFGAYIGVNKATRALSVAKPAALDIPGISWSAITWRMADNHWCTNRSQSGDCGCCEILVCVEDDEGYLKSEISLAKLQRGQSAASLIQLILARSCVVI